MATSPAIAPTATPSADLAASIDTRGDPPANDPIALAVRYGKISRDSAREKPFAGEPALGSKREFKVARITGAALSHDAPPNTVTIVATLHATSEHAYFYADDAIEPDPANMREAADNFEASVWPLVTGIFGLPPMPGVDGDPRIIVLQADLGGAVGGYYSGDDAYLRSVRPQSNEAEMVYLDRTLRPGGNAFTTVLAHEFQHLLHHNNDPGEEAWVNEGMSEATLILAGGAPSSIRRFAGKPETSLNEWPSSGTGPHYGAGAGFLRYLAHQLGGDAVLGGIGRDVADGPAGIDEYLATEASGRSFRDMFADWIVANILNRPDGPYANPEPVETGVQYEIAPGDSARADVPQFGTHYYALTDLYGEDAGEFRLSFDGDEAVDVLPTAATSGGPAWWSNAGDGIDTTLTFEADLASATSPSLVYRTWYDIEPWYDFGYVSVSTDGGNSWKALPGSLTTTDDPVQVALGPGLYGDSGGGEEAIWVDERLDLSAYAGQRILLRFEYVTDGSTHGRGWAVRDVQLDAAGGNLALAAAPSSDGWVYLDAPLAQDYVVRLILTRDDDTVDVRDIPLDQSRSGELSFSTIGVRDAVLAIAGTTEGTEESAPYEIRLEAR